MDNSSEKKKEKTQIAIPVRYIVIIIISFVMGAIFVLLIKNYFDGERYTWSTESLISFVFTIAIATASVILALIAIGLSRKAEESLIKRSDEGIRLQNESFIRTKEVLSDIQSSTGTTEKRLEDIISGRTAVIAKEAVEKSTIDEDPRITRDISERITEKISDSLRKELFPLLHLPPLKAEEILSEKEDAQKRIEQITKAWNEFRMSIIEKLKGFSKIKIISEAEGYIGSNDSSTFWDAVFEIDGKKASIDVHTREQIFEGLLKDWLTRGYSRERYLKQLTWRALNDNINYVFIISDENVWKSDGLSEISEKLALLNSKYNYTKFIIIFGSADIIAEKIYNISIDNKE